MMLCKIMKSQNTRLVAQRRRTATTLSFPTILSILLHALLTITITIIPSSDAFASYFINQSSCWVDIRDTKDEIIMHNFIIPVMESPHVDHVSIQVLEKNMGGNTHHTPTSTSTSARTADKSVGGIRIGDESDESGSTRLQPVDVVLEYDDTTTFTEQQHGYGYGTSTKTPARRVIHISSTSNNNDNNNNNSNDTSKNNNKNNVEEGQEEEEEMIIREYVLKLEVDKKANLYDLQYVLDAKIFPEEDDEEEEEDNNYKKKKEQGSRIQAEFIQRKGCDNLRAYGRKGDDGIEFRIKIPLSLFSSPSEEDNLNHRHRVEVVAGWACGHEAVTLTFPIEFRPLVQQQAENSEDDSNTCIVINDDGETTPTT